MFKQVLGFDVDVWMGAAVHVYLGDANYNCIVTEVEINSITCIGVNKQVSIGVNKQVSAVKRLEIRISDVLSGEVKVELLTPKEEEKNNDKY